MIYINFIYYHTKNMLKKILIVIIVTFFSIIGFGEEIDVSQIAVDYPYKDNGINRKKEKRQKLKNLKL